MCKRNTKELSTESTDSWMKFPALQVWLPKAHSGLTGSGRALILPQSMSQRHETMLSRQMLAIPTAGTFHLQVLPPGSRGRRNCGQWRRVWDTHAPILSLKKGVGALQSFIQNLFKLLHAVWMAYLFDFSQTVRKDKYYKWLIHQSKDHTQPCKRRQREDRWLTSSSSHCFLRYVQHLYVLHKLQRLWNRAGQLSTQNLPCTLWSLNFHLMLTVLHEGGMIRVTPRVLTPSLGSPKSVFAITQLGKNGTNQRSSEAKSHAPI